ncbi:MAG: ferritin-like domain-containing protein [Myxococcales bacterium]
MIGTSWLEYFEGNARVDCAPNPSLRAEVPRRLWVLLARSLGRFQLGESAGGRIHTEIATHPDRALDPPLRRAVQLYIEEEWRHARELALVIQALDGSLQTAHWTNGAFTACRRLLGLRTKMMTLAVAEVIGIVYYRALAAGIGSPALAVSLRRIANEESRHLDFQAAFFERAIAARARWALRALMLAILSAALVVLWLDHGRALRSAGATARGLASASWRELSDRRFLKPESGARSLGHRSPLRAP